MYRYPQVRHLSGGYESDDGVAAVIVATALGCVVAIVLLIIVGQYTTLPQYLCGVLGSAAKTTQPTRLLRKEIPFPDTFIRGYPTPVEKSPKKPPNRPRAQSTRGDYVRVKDAFQKFTTGKEPTVMLPGIPQPGGVSGADQVFKANKALINSVQNRELRQRMAAATWGVPKVYDNRQIGFQTYNRDTEDLYAKAQIRNAERLLNKNCLSMMFNLPQTFATATVPSQAETMLGRGIEFEV